MGDIRARLTSFSLSLPLLAVVGFTVGCGDNAPGKTGTGGSGGVTGTGGVAGTTGTGGNGGAATGGIGGAATGGIGGAATGGNGGAATGGNGGAATGGIGGAATGGIGGAATGGIGGATGGVSGTGGTTACYTTAFTAPTAGAALTVADDTDHTCANGFQYTVTITSTAPNGTDVTLYDGSSLLKTVQVNGGTASFAVQLATSGTAQQLAIQYPSTATCNVTENVTVTCPNSPPTCTLSKPVISATHPDLNGVAAPQGDRTSSVGSPYQATFVVNTSAEDGQTVTLAVDNAAAPGTPVDGTPSAVVSAGDATFGLTLAPDGTYEVIATCVNKNGITGTSTKSSFTVDTTPPDLTINSPTAGQFLGPLTNGRFNVCAQTSSTDAANLPSSLGPGQSNLCVTLGSAATPSCVAVAAPNASSCVAVTCPGGAPFNLTVTLNDLAGNPTVQTINGVSCASTLPSVQIVSPTSDAPLFNDQSKHILAANAPTGVKDKDAATAGAQADVVACTDTAGAATLFVGHKGDASLAQLGSSVTTVAAVAADNCPTGLGFAAHFTSVTLPESTESATGALVAATELTVSVTSAANSADIGSSGADDVWVDSVAPSLALASPAGLCGSFTQSPTTVTEDVAYTADDKLVVADVTNNGVTTTFDTPAFVNGVATFGSVAFAEGQNALVATESDLAGNATVLATCTVTIGSGPVVTFTTPIPGALLCPSTATDPNCIKDSDPATPGWQGTLAVTVTAGGPSVVGSVITFTDGSTTLGSATTDAGGNAQITGVTVPEGVQTLTATTDNVPGAGVGHGSVNVTVDTTAPNAPTALTVSITDRRKTSMHLTWTAPSDVGGGSVSGYQVRYAKVPITAANFDDLTVATLVTYSGSPSSPGQPDGVTVSPLYIESGYYFAVEATDISGTRSAMLASPASGACTCATQCCAAHFVETTLTGSGAANEEFGFQFDASGDVDGNGISDMLVGVFNGQHAYLYLGAAGGFAPSAPSVVISGDATTKSFGRGVAMIGDIDSDGLEDFAISDRAAPQRVFIFKGRQTWPATMTIADADYVVSPDPTDAKYTNSLFGISMARLGDFNGDGIDDFAIGANQYGTALQGRVIIVLGKSGFGNITLPDVSNTITIDADQNVTAPLFGYRVLGLGHFYPSTGNTLIIAAPGNTTGTLGTEGRIYAFRGQAGTNGVIPISAVDSVVVGPGSNTRIGTVLSNLGPMLSTLPSVGSGNPVDRISTPGNGSLWAFNGNAANGPFTSHVALTQIGSSQSGEALAGGGISGRNLSLSLIGDAKPDLVVASQLGTTFNIIDGNVVAATSSPANASSVASVTIAFPTGWTATGEGEGGVIPDISGDTAPNIYPDFAFANASGAVPGSVAVYW